jgi:hypothetical protein
MRGRESGSRGSLRDMAAHLAPVVYRGRLVAVAGRTRCFLLCPESLHPDEIKVVALMCQFVGRARASGRSPRDLNARAEAWALAILREEAAPTPGLPRVSRRRSD